MVRVARSNAANPLALASMLREEVSRARPGFRVTRIRTQDGILQAQIVRERLVAVLAVFLAAVALLLAGIGLYGVLDYSVFQRRREIGIRMAVGARAASIVGLVTVGVLAPVLAGVVAGGALSILSARYIGALLYQVRVTDFEVLAIPVLIILAVGLVSGLPATIHAVQLDPVDVLRVE
jgi:putative ABC transport system permease protein